MEENIIPPEIWCRLHGSIIPNLRDVDVLLEQLFLGKIVERQMNIGSLL
jgi:hypothetical protein